MDENTKAAPPELLDDFAKALRRIADKAGTDICAMAAVVSQTADNAGTVDTLLDDRFSQAAFVQLLGGLIGNYALSAGLTPEQVENLMGVALAQASAALTGQGEGA